MRIEEDIKIDFNNVLIKPKRSTLSSRRDVDLTREYKFHHSPHVYKGVPIIAANMDGVGTFTMAKALQKFSMLTAIRKHYKISDWEAAVGSGLSLSNILVCTGANAIFDPNAEDYVNAKTVLERWPDINFICVDIANGYQENFVDFVKKIRDDFPTKVIAAGNVCTPEMTEQLILSGADIVKIGIGPGCFVPGTRILTEDEGLKGIELVSEGQKVLTHKGRYRTVTNTFKFNDKKKVVKINGIEATPNHEFYVLHKKYRDIVSDDNIDEYAEWVEAKDLTKDYLLLEVNLND